MCPRHLVPQELPAAAGNSRVNVWGVEAGNSWAIERAQYYLALLMCACVRVCVCMHVHIYVRMYVSVCLSICLSFVCIYARM